MNSRAHDPPGHHVREERQVERDVERRSRLQQAALDVDHYEIAWKVMNESPMGSARVSSGRGMPRPIESRNEPISRAKKP
jgi:hypothetical protein